MLSFILYKNVIRYAIEHKFLDTELTKTNWESRMFQFYAGDLYEAIPKVAQKFLATEEVSGSCKAEPSNITVGKGTHEAINVTINYDCDLRISGIKITDFKVALTSVVEGVAHSDHLKFHVVGFSRDVQFFIYDGYEVRNLELAELMVSHSLNRLMERHVFGSNWPLYTKDYPHFMVEENYTVVYDSTHVGPGIATE